MSACSSVPYNTFDSSLFSIKGSSSRSCLGSITSNQIGDHREHLVARNRREHVEHHEHLGRQPLEEARSPGPHLRRPGPVVGVAVGVADGGHVGADLESVEHRSRRLGHRRACASRWRRRCRRSAPSISSASWTGAHTSTPRSVARQQASRSISAPLACIGKLRSDIGRGRPVTRIGPPEDGLRAPGQLPASTMCSAHARSVGNIRRKPAQQILRLEHVEPGP